MNRQIPPESDRSVSAPARWTLLWPYLLLAALAFGMYANSLDNGFVSDDRLQLLNNPLVLDWAVIPELFRHDVWAYAGESRSHYYRPLQMVVYTALHEAFGFNAVAFHLLLLVIHTGNTLLVYNLGRRMLAVRDPAPSRRTSPLDSPALSKPSSPPDSPALVAAILFAVHPIHNEAVVWIAALPDVLVTLSVLTALILWARWEAAPRATQIAVLSGLFFLALLTKEIGAMLLPLLAAYEFLYLGRPFWPPRLSSLDEGGSGGPRNLWQNWALYASLTGVVGVYALMRFHALGGTGLLPGGDHDLHGRVLVLSIITLLGQYLLRLVWPTHLNFYHVFEPTVAINARVILSLAVELVVLACVFLPRARGQRVAGKGPLLSYSLALMLLPLAPVLSINSVGASVFAERYLYLPSVGFVMVVAVAWEWLAGGGFRFAALRRVTAGIAVAMVVAVSAWILLPRNLDWHDNNRLVRAGLEESPKSAILLKSLGGFYADRKQYDEAIELLQRSVALDPRQLDAWVNLGGAYEAAHRDREALMAFRQATELDQDDPHMYAAHFNVGVLYARSNSWAGAVGEFEKALQLKPDFAPAQQALAHAREKIKEQATAEERR